MSQAARRVAILTGWVAATVVVWLAVPFVTAYALGGFFFERAEAADLAQSLIRLLVLLWASSVPAALAWLVLLTAGGHRQAAGLLATLVATASFLSNGSGDGSLVIASGGDPLADLRRAVYGIVSVVVAWLFALAFSGVLLAAEPATEETPAFEEAEATTV